jgi:putative transcriptional regulator
MAKKFKTLRGQLLLDGGSLRGSFFHRTVVLICEHDSKGAFGLVLNRGTERRLEETIDPSVPEFVGKQRLYLGGPVQPSALSFVYSHPVSEGGSVIPGVSLGHSLETLVDLGRPREVQVKLRVFAGYAGWSAGQLDDEMKRGAWITHPAKAEWIFQEQPEMLWKLLLKEKGWPHVLLGEAPEDLAMN